MPRHRMVQSDGTVATGARALLQQEVEKARAAAPHAPSGDSSSPWASFPTAPSAAAPAAFSLPSVGGFTFSLPDTLTLPTAPSISLPGANIVDAATAGRVALVTGAAGAALLLSVFLGRGAAPDSLAGLASAKAAEKVAERTTERAVAAARAAERAAALKRARTGIRGAKAAENYRWY